MKKAKYLAPEIKPSVSSLMSDKTYSKEVM